MTLKSTNTVGEKTKTSDLQKAASLMARAGGSKGGLASAAKLTPKQRKDRGRKAVMVRWKKKKQITT